MESENLGEEVEPASAHSYWVVGRQLARTEGEREYFFAFFFFFLSLSDLLKGLVPCCLPLRSCMQV